MTDIAIIPLRDEDTRKIAAGFALTLYADEPCRICRKILTMADVHDGAKFAGYSRDGKARAAHRVCWENFVEMLETMPAERLQELMQFRDVLGALDAAGERDGAA